MRPLVRAAPSVQARPHPGQLPPAATFPSFAVWTADATRTYPVSQLVNNPRNDRPGCLTAAV
jgi:hypothetical protein